MKVVTAFVQPHRVDAIVLALHGIEALHGASVSDGRGFGRRRKKGTSEKAREDLEDFLPHRRLEIVCRSEMVETVVSTIEQHAHTGLRGDGIVFVTSVENVVRISNHQRGENAI